MLCYDFGLTRSAPVFGASELNRQAAFSTIMRFVTLTIIGFLYAGAVSAQSEAELMQAAKLGFIESQYKTNAEMFRSGLIKRGLSREQAEDVLFQVLDEFASCMVIAVKAQAVEQGLPVDIVLDAFGGKGLKTEQAKIVMELDTEKLKGKTDTCTRNLGEALGVNIREGAD